MKTLDSRSGYDLYAPHYRKDHAHLDGFDWEAARALVAAELEARLAAPEARGLRLLDLGCGDGRTLKRFERLRAQRGWEGRLELNGWDISEGMVRQAAKALGKDVKLSRRDLLDPPPAGPGFDLVASFFVLVHIDRPIDFARAVFDLLAPGGLAVFNNIPQREALTLEAGGQKFKIDYVHHEDDDVAAALGEAGFAGVELTRTDWSALFSARRP